MKITGQVGAMVGFSAPADGWHRVAVQDGINLSVNEGSQKESLMVPFAIDEDGEDSGKRVTLFINTRDENKVPYKSVGNVIGNLLINLKMDKAFAAAFPDGTDILDPKVIEALKIKLAGKFMYLRTKVGKDLHGNDRVNIAQMQTEDFRPEAPKAAKAAAPKAETQAASPLGW